MDLKAPALSDENATQDSPKEDILIIDDALDNLNLLSQMLTRQGYRARAVQTGEEALAAVQSALPDLILLDIMMPEMDGYEVCKRLKADKQSRDIPIIFISALERTQDKVKGFAVGGVDFVTKPFHLKEVLARVETHLALRKAQINLREQNVQLEREVAERVRAGQTLHRYAERLKVLHEIDQSILAARSPETIAVAAISRVRQLIPCQRAMVMEVEETGQIKALATASSGEIGPGVDVYREMFEEQSLKSGRVRGVEDLATLPRRSPMLQALRAAGVRSYIVAPLFIHGELVGALNLEATQPRAFSSDHITIATEVAVLLAVAIRQARLYERAQREIAERKRVEAALRQQAQELEARNAELDAFAHTVAHDLKNPLTGLIGFSDLLLKRFDKMSGDQARRNLQMLRDGGRKMTNIIDELLLLASVREMQEVELQALDIAHLVAEVQKRLAHMIEEYQVEIISPPKDAWPAAQGYGPWIEEVWANYVSNAIRYGGHPPRIELGFSPPLEETKEGQVRFWVRDNGNGLTPEEQAELFTPFERLHQARTEGHGLGLSIVKRIMEKLGGQVGIESKVGQGSTFFFTLPHIE